MDRADAEAPAALERVCADSADGRDAVESVTAHAASTPRRFGALLARFAQGLLPYRCLLCGQRGAGRDLCLGCSGDLRPNRPCCARCALPLGVADDRGQVCGECLRHPPPFALSWVPFRYAHPLDLLETRFKFGADLAAGRVLTELLIERARAEPPPRPELVLPVPLHVERLRTRGYNQALELARPLARALDLPLRHDLLRRQRPTPAQTGLDAHARRRNLRGAFEVAAGIQMPAHVALFDDVMTTGSTLAECSRTLVRAGASRVDVWALARAPRPTGAAST